MLKEPGELPIVARRIAAHEMLMDAYATFADAAKSEALKVVILV